MTDTPTADLELLSVDDPSASPSTSVATGPRVRWAAIVWGLTFAAIAAGGFAVASSPAAMAWLIDAVADAELTTAIAACLFLVGGLVTIAGVAGLLRRAQRSLEGRRMHQSEPESTRQT
jgi:hypothetical protein